MNGHVAYVRKLRNGGPFLSLFAAVSLLFSPCSADGMAPPSKRPAPLSKEAVQGLYWLSLVTTPVVRWALRQSGLDKELEQLWLLFDRCDEVHVAVYSQIARRALDDQERDRLDERLREVQRRCPSWKKTYDLVGGAIAESDALLSQKYPKARIRVRLVAALYAGHVIRSKPEEPDGVTAFDLFRRSDLSPLLRELEDFTCRSGPDQGGLKSTRCDEPLAPQTSAFAEAEEPFWVLSRFQWSSLVDAELARTQNAGQLSTEALRRAPPTATVCITYEVLRPAETQGDATQIAALSLEVVKHEFTCTPTGWQRNKPNSGPVPSTQKPKLGDH